MFLKFVFRVSLFEFRSSTVNLRIPHGLRNTSQVLTQPPASALVGARHAVPLFHLRLSTVDSRLGLLGRRILRAKHALRIVLPDPGVDEPRSLRDKMSALLGALRFVQRVRI